LRFEREISNFRSRLNKSKELQAQLARPTISALEQSRREMVKDRLRNAPPEDLAVLKHILKHGQVDPVGIIAEGIPGETISQWVIEAAINRCFVSGLLKHGPPTFGVGRQAVMINPDLFDALSSYLFDQ